MPLLQAFLRQGRHQQQLKARKRQIIVSSTLIISLSCCILVAFFSSVSQPGTIDTNYVDFLRRRTSTSSSSSSAAAAFRLPKGVSIAGCVVLTIISAICSGLVLGLMSLDVTQLEILKKSTNATEAKNARRIYPLRMRGNLLLCTLTWANQACNALQAIVLAELVNPIVGFVLSTVILVIFAEILPQAVCSRYALPIGAFLTPFLKVLIVLLLPLSYPFAFLLDRILGRELGLVYTKDELEQLLHIQASRVEGFNREMATAMAGALKYYDMAVHEIMTPIENVYMLSSDVTLSYDTLIAIFKAGHSRIPIYEGSNKNDIIGLLLTKDLIFIDPDDEVPISSFIEIFGRALHFVWPDDSLGDVLRELKQGKSHLALVRDVNNTYTDRDPFYESKGIVTMEDIIEIILGDKIYDETDAVQQQQQQQQQKTDQRTDFDWDRLKLLDSKRVGTTLTEAERKAVLAFLRAHYNDVLSQLSDSNLEEMIAITEVSEIDGGNLETMVYQKGLRSDLCTVVLSGKLTVVAGKDEFRSEIGPWSVLAIRALLDTNYTPDFSAYVSSRSCRCLRIHRTSCNGSTMKVSKEKEAGESYVTETQLMKEAKGSNGNKSNDRTDLLNVFNESVRSYGEIEKLAHGPTDLSITTLKSKLTKEGKYAPRPTSILKEKSTANDLNASTQILKG